MDIFPSRSSKGQEPADGSARIPLTEEERLQYKQGFRPARMSDITWRIFRIMSEFVEGFQFLSTTSREVSIFGSTRIPPGNKWYEEAVKLGALLGKNGYTVVTGGGPGIMEAANKGAFEVGARSVGLNIQLPKEQRINPYVTESRAFYYFFTRKVMLAASAQAYVYFPGGFGTLDEMFEILTLIQTGKSEKVPMILVGREYWGELWDWLKNRVYGKMDAIDRSDLDLVRIVDSAEEAYAIVAKSTARNLF